MFGNWRSLSSIYSQAKTGSWALNDSLETADKNLWGLLLSCWTESHWNYFLWGKLSCEQDTLLLFILLQPGQSVPCWWKPGDYFLVICVYFEDSCIWVKTGAVELHFIFFPPTFYCHILQTLSSAWKWRDRKQQNRKWTHCWGDLGPLTDFPTFYFICNSLTKISLTVHSTWN